MGEAFFRIPPFPGHRADALARRGPGEPLTDFAVLQLIAAIRRHRVGGAFWAARPPFPAGCDLLLAPESIQQARDMLAEAKKRAALDRCVMIPAEGVAAGDVDIPMLPRPADPWHLADAATEVWAGADHEIALIAALAGRELQIWGSGRYSDCIKGEQGIVRAVQRELASWSYRSPFSGETISAGEAIAMLSDWRRLIDDNRHIAGVFGVAAWKRPTVNTMLWNGSSAPNHLRHLPKTARARVVVWKSRTSAGLLDRLERSDMQLVEIEDGMIRGPGLGANCVPPLSIVLDRFGIYFDPSQLSDLEQILATADMDKNLLRRASRLRQRIVAEGISKYGGGDQYDRKPSGRRQILVVGQVEDDRSILSGGNRQTNLELLERARALEPDAWIIYRPHPDVEAGHRKGHIPDETVLHYADEIEHDGSISRLIDCVDGLHCITSLAGFEALLRGKPVTTHGVPFYAGWGLTRDLAQVPARRNRRRSLDELVAATLILYPRYLDPVTRLPCPPETVIDRMAHGEASISAPLSGMRKMQGKLKVALRRLREIAA